MPLPVTPEYLMSALEDGHKRDGMTLSHHRIADLVLSTGQLVACDPFVLPDPLPFTLSLPCGTFPVVLSIAQIKTDQRVAFATLRFSQALPVKWEMMTVGNQDISTLKEDELFGYGVDAGTGCFIDLTASRALALRMGKEENFYETLMAEMEKTYKHTWSWLDVRIGDGNLIAFSSGYGDGFYGTYAGRDCNGQVSAVVTDFGVVPFEEPPRKASRRTLASLVMGFLRKR
jgi:hypothetical protein